MNDILSIWTEALDINNFNLMNMGTHSEYINIALTFTVYGITELHTLRSCTYYVTGEHQYVWADKIAHGYMA
jgi:hypothetical protein